MRKIMMKFHRTKSDDAVLAEQKREGGGLLTDKERLAEYMAQQQLKRQLQRARRVSDEAVPDSSAMRFFDRAAVPT